MTDTVNIRLKLESIKMDQGYFQDGSWINKSEMNYVGEIIQINEGLAEHGIDLTGELGNMFYFSIDFEEDPIYAIPKDCEVQSIGWLELNHRPHTSANHMRVKLSKKEFSDFLMLKNNPIHIEPNFNKRKDKKIITEKNEKKVLFHISRITLTPSINNN